MFIKIDCVTSVTVTDGQIDEGWQLVFKNKKSKKSKKNVK